MDAVEPADGATANDEDITHPTQLDGSDELHLPTTKDGTRYKSLTLVNV